MAKIFKGDVVKKSVTGFTQIFLQRHYFLLFFSLVLFSFFIVGCGSDNARDSSKISKKNKAVSESGINLSPLSPQILHETGVETFALGISSDDPGALVQGISLLEQAALADPDNSIYWIDLADAYMASGNVLEYSYAIDIYWMLLSEDNPQQDALLSRLIEAYTRAGNFSAAFDAAIMRLAKSKPEQVDKAGLHLAMIAMSFGAFDKAAKALIKKAGDIDDSAYLLLLAASLEQVSGDSDLSKDLLNKILDDNQNIRFAKSIEQAKQRMKQ